MIVYQLSNESHTTNPFNEWFNMLQPAESNFWVMYKKKAWKG